MKKLYLTSNLVKVVSLGAAMATLLSSVSPIFAANLAITGNVNLGTGAPGVLYPHGSHGSVVLAGDDDYCGADNVVGRGGKQQQSVAENRKITAEEQYRRFIENLAFNGYNPYGTTTQQAVWNGDSTTTQNSGYMGTLTGGIPNAMPEAFGVYSFATGCGSSATGNYSTAFGAGATAKAGGAQAFGVSALASGKASVAMGVGSEASGESTVALGGLATATGKESIAIGTKTKAKDSYAVAIGIEAEAKASGSIAIGSGSSKRSPEPNRKVIAEAENSIAIGTFTFAEKDDSVAIGANAQARVRDGVAIGGGSVSRVEKGVNGYDPVTDTISTEVSETWKSTAGAFSVGDTSKEVEGYKITRQITGVAAGTEDTDAVNVAQLKALKDIAAGGWKLSVNGSKATDVDPGSTVDFSVNKSNVEGAENLKIAKEANNNIKFALNENLKLTSVTTGRSTMSDDGFVIADGPRMTSDGIDGGNQKITGVEKGTDDNDAVNFAQLKEIKNEIAGNTLVKWQEDGQLITIGKEKGGTKIDIAGSGGNRTITGVKAGEQDTDAVNYGQFKTIKSLVEEGWKLSVSGQEATSVALGSTVDFSVDNSNVEGAENLKIAKEANNNIKFALNENLKLTSVTTGRSTMSDDGFVIADGPRMTSDGIDGGNQKITGVEEGTDESDAVNVAQLNKIKNEIAGNTLVKWQEDEQLITIGKEKGGTKIDIAGSSGDRTIRGVKAGEQATDAVNFAQLKEMKNEIAGNTLVKWQEDGQLITIGKEKDGTKIDIANQSGADRIISGVAKGRISDSSKEAINGSQINKIAGDIANYFGGDAGFVDGAFVGPQYNLTFVGADGETEQKVFKDVGSALRGLDGNVRNVNSRLTNVSNVLNQRIDNFSQDALLWSENERAFVALHGNGEGANSKITFLLDGEIAEDSTDAINGSQINKIAGDIANYFGGDAGFVDGAFVGPQYNLTFVGADGETEQKVFKDVGSALRGLDGNVRNVNSRLTNVSNVLNQRIDNFSQDALLWSENERAFVALHGNGEGANSKITFLLDGEIAEDSTDAINGSQLFKIAENTSKFFGGSANVINSTNPAFLIDGEAYDNVTDAFIGVNTFINNINNKIIDMEKNDLVQQDASTNIITIGKKTAGTEISIAGYGNSPRTISGVRKAENGDQAVNKDQLDESIEKISQNIETVTAAAVLYDKKEDGTVNYGSVTLGGKNNNNEPVALLNVKNGNISEDSHDAINGSQINKIAGDIANYFGGDTKFENGIFSAPTYTLSVITEDGQGENAKVKYHDVGSALKGLDSNIQSVDNRLTNVVNEFTNQFDGFLNDALLWSEEEQAFVAKHGKNGEKTKSKLKFLLDGEIAQGSTDAITGNQLYLLNQTLATYFGGGAKYENGQWTAPDFKISQFDANGTAGEKKSYNNVSDAFDGINNGMSNINNRINDVINKVDSDALKWNEEENAYDAGRGGKPNRITNVADGEIAENSKDAVNGGQLWQTNERISDVEKDVKHIGDRVDNISGAVTDIGETVINIENKVDGIAEDAVRYDRDKNGKKINKVTLKGGDASEPVTIDNVADGKIEEGSKQAINGGQLHDYTKEQMKIILDESKNYTDQRVNNIVIDAIDDAVERANNYTNMKFDALSYSIENVRKEAKQAAAIGLAVSNLRYSDMPGKLSIGFGTGLWRSQSAFAFGTGYTSENGSLRSNVSVSTSGGHWGVGAGFNMILN
ncbi:autotransporter adhesin [Bartonella japonica]|uniref:Autotransporter adhesin n=1 Tax=Bartonella japonica TaxID=357761 RepID=A0ABV2FMB7_9HYPH